MDHEKKKRQKKKKNKQGKANYSHQNHQNVNSENSDGNVTKQNHQQTVVDSDRESVNGAESSRSVEAEKSYWLNREASLEQKIKELQEQLDVHVQREADLERNISQSQKERSLWHHKEVSFEEKRIQMEEEKVNLAQRENSAAETVTSLNKDNARLRAQVTVLESSRNDIYHQNQQLKEHMSNLLSKIQDLEESVATRLSSEMTKKDTEYEDMNSQLESARALVAKLLSENDELVEKVNILNAELDQKSVTTQSSLPDKPADPTLTNSESADMDESSAPETDSMPSSAEKLDAVSIMGLKDGMPSDKLVNHMNSEGSDLNQISRVSLESGEIVQISLDENDVMVATSASYVPEKGEAVPLIDAPLIGAPFRLISFVARYVSGSDLIQK